MGRVMDNGIDGISEWGFLGNLMSAVCDSLDGLGRFRKIRKTEKN